MPTTYNTLTEFQRDYQYDLSDPSMHLGEGSYGQVVRAFDHQNNKWVALKIGKDLMQEYEAARSLNHRNIAKYEACYRINDRNIGQRDYAIMQLYMAGNLANLLQTTTLADVQKKELVRGILEGLQYLHAQKRIHRDFKPANILIAQLPNGNYRPLIADFGLTKIVGQKDYLEGSDVQLSDGRGTASYKAPEQIAGETAHYNLDLWAFGVILYEITTGDRPFKRGSTGTDQQRDNELYRQIQNVALPPQLNSIAEPYQAMIRRCLIKDIHQRVRKEDELLGLLEGGKEPKPEPKTDEPAPKPKPKPVPAPLKTDNSIENLTKSKMGFEYYLKLIGWFSLGGLAFGMLCGIFIEYLSSGSNSFVYIYYISFNLGFPYLITTGWILKYQYLPNKFSIVFLYLLASTFFIIGLLIWAGEITIVNSIMMCIYLTTPCLVIGGCCSIWFLNYRQRKTGVTYFINSETKIDGTVPIANPVKPKSSDASSWKTIALIAFGVLALGLGLDFYSKNNQKHEYETVAADSTNMLVDTSMMVADTSMMADTIMAIDTTGY